MVGAALRVTVSEAGWLAGWVQRELACCLGDDGTLVEVGWMYTVVV